MPPGKEVLLTGIDEKGKEESTRGKRRKKRRNGLNDYIEEEGRRSDKTKRTKGGESKKRRVLPEGGKDTYSTRRAKVVLDPGVEKKAIELRLYQRVAYLEDFTREGGKGHYAIEEERTLWRRGG